MKYIIRYFVVLFFSGLSLTSISQDIPKWKITDVEKYIAAHDGVVVVNMWATFCKPCLAEMPALIRISDENRKNNVKLLLVSLDLPSFYPKKLDNFIKKRGFKGEFAWLDETNADYFCPRIDKSWSGSIPATLIVNTKTGYRKFIEEEMTGEEFEKELKKAME